MHFNNFSVIHDNSHNITVVINNSRFVNSYLISYIRNIAENKNLLLFLDGNMILSLPSFVDSGCQVALPGSTQEYGVAGTVTDSDASPRLMVCFKDGCWLRGENWIQNDSLDLRYSLL